MASLPRDVAQTLIEKLDLNAITPSYAREHAEKHYRVKLAGRTRDAIIRSIKLELRK